MPARISVSTVHPLWHRDGTSALNRAEPLRTGMYSDQDYCPDANADEPRFCNCKAPYGGSIPPAASFCLSRWEVRITISPCSNPRQIPRIYPGSSRTDVVQGGLLRTLGQTGHVIEIAGDRLAALRGGVLIARGRNGPEFHAVLGKQGSDLGIGDIFRIEGRRRLESIPLDPAFRMRVDAQLRLVDVFARRSTPSTPSYAGVSRATRAITPCRQSLASDPCSRRPWWPRSATCRDSRPRVTCARGPAPRRCEIPTPPPRRGGSPSRDPPHVSRIQGTDQGPSAVLSMP